MLDNLPPISCAFPGPITDSDSYNRYLAIAARTVRRSLKEGPRLQAERRGQMDLRFAKWEVRRNPCYLGKHELVGSMNAIGWLTVRRYRTANRAT